MFMALFSYNQGHFRQIVAGRANRMVRGTNTGLTLYFWNIQQAWLFSRDQILLNATALHLNGRRPDSDLLFFPAKIILFHFACFGKFPSSPYLQLHLSTLISLLSRQGWVAQAAPHYHKEEQSRHERMSRYVTHVPHRRVVNLFCSSHSKRMVN